MARLEAIGYPGALRGARRRKGMSQPDVELYTSLNGRRISASTVANLERGARQPSKEILELLTRLYEVEVDEIGHLIAEGEQVCSTCRGFAHVVAA